MAGTFSEIQDEFFRYVGDVVYATMTMVDAKGRPGRLLPGQVWRERGPLREVAIPWLPRGHPEYSYEPYGSRISIRIPHLAHESCPWRIREIAPDFTVEDVWALPVRGSADDFQRLLEVMVSLDPANSGSLPLRVLWRLRDRLGGWFGLGRISGPIDRGRDTAAGKLPIPGTDETSLAGRLPDELRDTAADPDSAWAPFAPLYRTDVEFAAELSNRTVHSVMHLAWVDRGGGPYQGQMAVYVKPRGRLGEGYMVLIKPFRYWAVYPALMREIERAWKGRVPQ